MKHSLKKTLSIILVAAIMICSASLTGLADNVKEEISTQSSALVAPNYGALDRYKNPVWTEDNPCPTVIAKDESLSDDWFVYGLRQKVNNSNLDYINVYSNIKYYIIANGGDFEIIYADEKFSPYVGTGSVIDVYGGSDNSDNSENYYIVIFGDVDGDSTPTSHDVAMIESEMKGITHWSDPESEEYEPYKVKASDMDKNGKIDLYDYCIVSSIVLGVYFVDQRTGAFFDDNESLYTLIYYYDTEPYNDIKFFQLESGAEIEELPETPEKEGYVFNGWIDYETGEPLESVMPARDVVAYPSWKTEGCQHDYILTETISPTCTGDGIETYTCTKCGYSYTKSIPTWIVHKLGDWEVVIEPTCIAEGVEARICESCGAEVETRKIPVSPHIPTEWVVIKEPTCAEEGMMIRFCMNCDAVLSEEAISAKGHDEVEYVTVKCATCTEDGVEVLVCTVCNAVLRENTIYAPGHTPGEWITTKEPTFFVDGERVRKCQICDVVLETETIFSHEHYGGKWIITKQPTCTEKGEKAEFCVMCDAKLNKETIPATDHDSGKWITTVAPTCTEKGEKVLACTVCDAVLMTVDIPELGHVPCYCEWEWVPDCNCHYCKFAHPCVVPEVYHIHCYYCGEILGTIPNPDICKHEETEWVVVKEATCTEKGEKAEFCVMCDAKLNKETIPATGHTPGEWEVTTPATCTEKGEKVLACTVCDAVLKTMEIPELGHVAPEPEPKPPVCGVETFKILCVRCGLQEIVFIPHDPGEWVVISEPTETTPGMEVCCCEICGEVLETREISPLEHTHKKRTVTIPATCTVAGMEYDICETCGERIGEAKVLPATGHKPGSWIVSIEPDCENDGEKVCNCSVCGAVCETETIPANGHIPGEWETVMESTAETEGLRIKKCVVCGNTVEEEIIPKKTVLTDDGTGVGIEIDSGDYDGEVEIVVSETFDGSAFNLVNTETEATRSMIYDIKITVDGEEVQPNGKVRVRMPLPEGYDESRTFVYHVDTSTGIVEGMKAAVETINGKKYLVFETTHFSYYAVVEECGFTMEIRNPSTTTINYGDSIILHADIEGKLPAGYTVRWSASNSNFSYETDGAICEITPEKSGDTVFTATIYDSSGKEVIKDEQTMTSKAGFFQKIIAFFKRIFGLTKIYPDVLGL